MPLPLPPMIQLAIGGLFLALGPVLRSKSVILGLWIAGWLATAVSLVSVDSLFEGPSPGLTLHHVWNQDHLALWSQISALVFSLLIQAIAFPYQPVDDSTYAYRTGFFAFLVAGIMLVAGANDAIALALSFEILRLSSVSLARLRPRSETTPMGNTENEEDTRDEKPFWFEMIASTITWMGIALLYVITGATDFDEVRRVLASAYTPDDGKLPIGAGSKLGVLALGLMITGLSSGMGLIPWRAALATKLSRCRFHTSGPTILAGQIAGTLALLRLCGTVWIGFASEVTVLLIVLTTGTFLVAGSLAAKALGIGEGSVKRYLESFIMLNGAWLMVGIIASVGDLRLPTSSLSNAGQQLGAISITVFSMTAGLTGLLGLFAILNHLSRDDHGFRGDPKTSSLRDIEYIDELTGLIRMSPASAIVLAISILSLIGQPPLWGFWGKWLLMVTGFNMRATSGEISNSTTDPHHGVIALVIVGICSTLLVAGIVIRSLRVMLLDLPLSRLKPSGGQLSLIAGVTTSLVIVGAGLVPTTLFVPLSYIAHPKPRVVKPTPAGTRSGSATAQASSPLELPP